MDPCLEILLGLASRGWARTGGEALERDIVVVVGCVEAEDRRGFDSGDGDVGQWQDATAAYEGWTGEIGRGEGGDSWVGVSVG